nr:NADP-reducing hydrogenase subunit HndC [Candidatus Anoxychlamydiales bacterium]
MKNILLFILLAAFLIVGITTYRNFKKEKPLVVIMMGAPGSGKGTQATKLSKTLNIAHISTGDLFRENMKNQTELGIKVKELIFDICGGMQEGSKFKAVQLGGPTGGCLPYDLLDTNVDYESLMKTGAVVGSGGLVVVDQSTCMVDMARFFLSFAQNESCGKCT